MAKNQHTDQWTRRTDPEVKSHVIATCYLAKGKKQNKQQKNQRVREKTSASVNGAEGMGFEHVAE